MPNPLLGLCRALHTFAELVDWSSEFARATVTKYHQRRGFNNRYLLPPSSAGRKFEISLSAGLVSAESCEGESV